MENKMDNDFDFRVGDVVCDIQYGTGKVAEIRSRDPLPLQVAFEDGKHAKYQMDGRWSCLDKGRSLYHGTWGKVFGNLPDLKPKRKVKRWVNLYCRENQIIAGHAYPRPEEAKAVCDASLVAKAIEIEVDE